MNRKALITLGAAAVLLLGGVVSQIGAQDNAERLSIAFIGAERGAQATIDRNLYQAAALAAEQINADSDDLLTDADGTRYSLEVRYYGADGANDVADALTEADEDSVIAILGPNDDDRLDALRAAGTPQSAVLTTANNAVTADRIFRLTATDDQRAEAAADYLVNQRFLTRVAIVTVDSTSAEDGAAAFRAAAGEANIAVELTHTVETTDFTSDAETIREGDVQAIYAWTLDAQMRALLNDLGQIGWTGTVIYAGLDADFVNAVGELPRGVNLFGVVDWDAAAYDSDSQQFTADFAARWENAVPTSQAAVYFDAVNLIAEAIRASNEGDSADALITALRNGDGYDGVQGTYDAATSDGLLLIEKQASSLVEAARYEAGACLNCTQTAVPDVTDSDAANRGLVTISLMGALNNAPSISGQAAQQAIELAIREINDNGGILGPNDTRYVFSLEESNVTNSAQLGQAVDAARQNGTTIILGPDANAALDGAGNLAAAAGIPQLVSATSAQITLNDVQDFLFQMRADDAVLANAALGYLLDERDLTRFGIVTVRADYGQDTANLLERAIADSDEGQVTVSLNHDIAQTDFSAIAAEIAASNTQAIFAWTTQPAAAALVEALGAADWTGVVVYGYLTPEMSASMTIPAEIEMIAPVNWWQTAGDWASQAFAARYASRFGQEPFPQSASYYDAVYLIAAGVQAVGAAPADLQAWLLEQDRFQGVQGVYQPATYGDGELSRSVMLLGSIADGFAELARYENGVCWAGCGS
jgi:branched-chain amino acid transport system substrate-binding protein